MLNLHNYTQHIQKCICTNVITSIKQSSVTFCWSRHRTFHIIMNKIIEPLLTGHLFFVP